MEVIDAAAAAVVVGGLLATLEPEHVRQRVLECPRVELLRGAVPALVRPLLDAALVPEHVRQARLAAGGARHAEALA